MITLILAANICTVPIAVTTPCEGVLLPPDAAKEGLAALEVDIPKLRLQLEFERDIHKVREERDATIIGLLSDSNKQLSGLLGKDPPAVQPIEKEKATPTELVIASFLSGALIAAVTLYYTDN